jgi:hypothetical protein
MHTLFVYSILIPVQSSFRNGGSDCASWTHTSSVPVWADESTTVREQGDNGPAIYLQIFRILYCSSLGFEFVRRWRLSVLRPTLGFSLIHVFTPY